MVGLMVGNVVGFAVVGDWVVGIAVVVVGDSVLRISDHIVDHGICEQIDSPFSKVPVGSSVGSGVGLGVADCKSARRWCSVGVGAEYQRQSDSA